MTITAYRIAKKRFAKTIWSGEGAREHGGRWSSKGIPVVYAAENRSLAALEQLVHPIEPRILRGYVVASITFDDVHVARVDPAKLPRGWDNPVPPATLRQFGDEWFVAGRYPVLAAPSAVTPGEWNFLINPAHSETAGMMKFKSEPVLKWAILSIDII